MPSQGAGVPLAAPPHALPKGREFLPAVFEVVVWRSFPLGKVRMGLAGAPSPWEGTEKLKPTIKLKVDDGEIAVLPFIICLF